MSVKKVAVIGSGPAGLGVITGLLNRNEEIEIILFDKAKEDNRKPYTGAKDPKTIENYYSKIYNEIRKKFKFKFPPPKTYFGEKLKKYYVEGKEQVFKSEIIGGLSNYWGGGAVPFTDTEFTHWPLKRDEMDPYYAMMANLIGISGIKDKLNEYYGEDFVNRPPIKIPPIIEKLNNSINQSITNRKGIYKVLSGISRLMFETRENHPNSCVYCGECMMGCFNDTIYSTKKHIDQYINQSKIKLIRGQVWSVDGKLGNITLKGDEGFTNYDGFDKIYIAAGCPNSSEIVMRSLGITGCDVMADNSVYIFPIFYFGKGSPKKFNNQYIALPNLIWSIVPQDEENRFAQGTVYSNFDYLWRYNISNKYWNLFRGFISRFRFRLFWIRIFVHGDHSHAFRLNLKDDQLNIEYARYADTSVIKDIMKSVRHVVNKNGFYSFPIIPRLIPLLQKANSHYSSTFPYHGKNFNLNKYGEIMPNTYLCDSSVFPDLPAVSLTYTIMANACRVSFETINL
jgi:hypothetical protein